MADADPASLRFEGFTLDPAAHTLVDARGREVALRRSEYELLRAFLAAPRRALSRDFLLEVVASRRSDPFDRSIDVLVGRLRRKIEPEPHAPRLIVTVPGVGYRFAIKPQPVSAESAMTPVAAPAISPERRQLTVIQCGLCGPAFTSARRDPEDLHRVLTVLHEHAKSVVTEAGGTVDRLLSAGMMAYFGYPQADEHQAERAIRTALTLIEAAGRIDAGQSGRLQLRIGIATGLAVVGSQPAAAGQPTILGEAVHLAAGLGARAEPDAVLIAASTRRLVGELFELRACGRIAMQGAEEPVEAWAVNGISVAESRFESVRGGRLTGFVGREHELGLLLERWSLAQDGEGQVVLLSGEPGIGKSRIVRELRERLEQEGARSLRFQCSPYHVNSAFYPIIDNFERALQFAPEESPEAKLDKLEALMVGQYGRPRADVRFIAALLSIPYEARYGALAMTPQRSKDETLRALVDIVGAIVRQAPTVMLFEDAHWADPTTLEATDRLVQRVRTIPLLVVITHRPEFSPRWSQHGHVTALSLSKLTRSQSAAMVSRLAGKALPADLLEQILDKTDGVPLFVEELTKSILESAALRDAGDHWAYAGPADRLAIPLTLRDLLMARLDRVAPGKEIAQIGAVIGRAFSFELVAAVASRAEPELDQALAQLTASGLASQQGTPPEAVYTFKHALVRDAAYESLLKQRRQELHGKVAQAIEACFPNTEATEPELLAHHYTEAKQPERAIPLWQKAGELALRRSAYIEAAAHLERALNLIEELDSNSPQRTLQAPLQITYGNVLRMTRGFGAPETIAAFARAQELATAVKDAPERLIAQYGLWSGSFVRGELATMLEVSGAFLHCVEGRPESPEAGIAHRICGLSSWFQGDFIGAQAHLEQALATYDSDRDRELAFRFGQDVAVSAMAYLALVLWPLGAIDRARQFAERAVTHAIQTKHIATLAYAHAHKSVFEMMCHDGPRTVPHAEALVDLAREHGMPWWVANGTFFQGWARWKAGEHERGTAEMQKGMTLIYEQHQEIFIPLLATLAAEAEAEEGRLEAGLGTINAQLGRTERTGQHWFLAEVHRARGEIARKYQPNNGSKAESAFMRAIDIARSQSAKLFELRAATSLARLWAARGKSAEARSLLAPIYGWFTEGFGTKDVKEAGALLDELEAARDRTSLFHA